MAAKNSTAVGGIDKELTEEVTVSVRVPMKASGTLIDVVSEKLASVSGVNTVSIGARKGIEPKNGHTTVTVSTVLQFNVMSVRANSVREALENKVFVDEVRI